MPHCIKKLTDATTPCLIRKLVGATTQGVRGEANQDDKGADTKGSDPKGYPKESDPKGYPKESDPKVQDPKGYPKGENAKGPDPKGAKTSSLRKDNQQPASVHASPDRSKPTNPAHRSTDRQVRIDLKS